MHGLHAVLLVSFVIIIKLLVMVACKCICSSLSCFYFGCCHCCDVYGVIYIVIYVFVIQIM